MRGAFWWGRAQEKEQKGGGGEKAKGSYYLGIWLVRHLDGQWEGKRRIDGWKRRSAD